MQSRNIYGKSSKSRNSEVHSEGVDLGLSIQSSNLFGHIDFHQYKQMLMQERKVNPFVVNDLLTTPFKTDKPERPGTGPMKRMNSSPGSSSSNGYLAGNSLRGKSSHSNYHISSNQRSGSAATNIAFSHMTRNKSFDAATKPFSTISAGPDATPTSIPVVRRTAEEKKANPDRLSLDRRGLTACPVLDGEENLRLLNYQHNFITSIQNLDYLRRLIFLDLYDNRISSMANGLSRLTSLRVLMLGKNQIEKIEGLENLTRLDVLDLHANQITIIENVNHLQELRVLNLASNNLRRVENISAMESLTELNLRRNQIEIITEIDELPSLQRLFLSFNEMTSWSQMDCLSRAFNCTELSLEGNNISKQQHYRPMIINNIPQLHQLDGKRISEEERRQAHALAKRANGHSSVSQDSVITSSNDVSSSSQLSLPTSTTTNVDQNVSASSVNKDNIVKERRRLAIKNVQKQWEAAQNSSGGSSTTTATTTGGQWNSIGAIPINIPGAKGLPKAGGTSFYGHRDLVANHVGNIPAPQDDYEASISSSGVSCSTEQQMYSEENNSATGRSSRSSSARRSSRQGSARTTASSGRSSYTTAGKSSRGPSVERSDQASTAAATGCHTPQPNNNAADPADEEVDLNNVQILSGENATEEEGGTQCHVAEISEGKLKLYGTRSLEYLDKQVGLQAAGAVDTIAFCYIDFELIAPNMHKIKARFPSVETIILESVNLTNFQQINALAGLKKLHSLQISLEGNPFVHFQLWRHYIIFRLSHMKLTKINEIEITARETVEAERLFSALTHMTTVQLTLGQLLATIADTSRRHQEYQHQQLNVAKQQALLNGDSDSATVPTTTYFADVVGKLGLTHDSLSNITQKNELYKKKIQSTRSLVDGIFQQSLQSKSFRFQLSRLWPRTVHYLVNHLLDEMLDDPDAFSKTILDKIS